MIGVLIVMTGLGALILRTELSRANVDYAVAEKDISLHAGMAWLVGAILARFLILDFLRRNGFILFTMDEASRWHLSWLWSKSPYFFTSWDGVWLTGSFAYYGLWMSTFGNPAIGAHAGAIFAAIATIGAAYFLAYTLSRKHWIAALAAWLFAPSYHFLWYGHGALAESLLAGLAMFGLAFYARWIFAPDRWKNMRPGAAAAIFVFLASTLHFVAWIAFVAALFCLAIFFARRRLLLRTHRVSLALIIIAGLIFPLFWIIASKRALGDPFAFLSNQNSVMEALSLNYSPDRSTFSNFMQFPKALALQIGPLLLPMLILAAQSYRHPRLRDNIHLLSRLSLAILLLMSLLVTRNFYGLPERNITIVYSFSLILCAICFQVVERLWDGSRSMLHVGLFFIVAGWFGYNGLTANRFDSAGASVLDHELVAMGNWLKQQARRPENLTRFNPESVVGFTDFYDTDENLLLLEYISGVPDRLIAVSPENLSGGKPPHLDYLISSLNYQPERFRHLHTFGKWQIYEPAAE